MSTSALALLGLVLIALALALVAERVSLCEWVVAHLSWMHKLLPSKLKGAGLHCTSEVVQYAV